MPAPLSREFSANSSPLVHNLATRHTIKVVDFFTNDPNEPNISTGIRSACKKPMAEGCAGSAVSSAGISGFTSLCRGDLNSLSYTPLSWNRRKKHASKIKKVLARPRGPRGDADLRFTTGPQPDKATGPMDAAETYWQRKVIVKMVQCLCLTCEFLWKRRTCDYI